MAIGPNYGVRHLAKIARTCIADRQKLSTYYWPRLKLEARYSPLYAYRRATFGKGRREIFLYPEVPRTKRTMLEKICAELGIALSGRRTADTILSILWDDHTFTAAPPPEIAGSSRLLNDKCLDISKVRVADTFSKVFGYDLTVDPLCHEGVCVEKSDENATHDGQVIDCPITVGQPGFVYQRLVNNEVEGDMVEDIRVPVLDNSIPFVYLKFRAMADRFRDPIAASLEHAENVLSKDEISKIFLFCKDMGLEYGEVDALRDRTDGKLYIVDANKTPWGPPHGISKRGEREAVTKMAAAFSEAFL